MYLSKHKSGIYYVYYNSSNGKRGKRSTKTKFKNEALRFLHSFEFQQKQRSDEISLSKFVFQYLNHSESIHSLKTTRDYKTTFGFFQKFIDNPNLSEITFKQINEYLRERINSSSIYQGRKDLINLKSAFNYAVRNKYLIENPCKNIQRIKVPEKQPLYFSKLEYNKFLLSIDNEDFKDLVILAINTGMRQMELLTLTKEQIDINAGILTLDNKIHVTKSKKIRVIPLNERSKQVLNKRIVFDNVFSFGQRQTISLFSKYRTKSRIRPELTFHSLRHTFASWLVQKGVPILNVSKLLGHSDIKTTQIYAHLSTNDLASSALCS